MKVAINKCYGGFSLSPLAVQEIAKAKGLPCYFFRINLQSKVYTHILPEEANHTLLWCAFTVPNPQDYNLHERDSNGLYTSANNRATQIKLDSRPDNRTDPDLIRVIETLGDKANGKYSKIEIVEIPDGVQWEINEYDGLEHIDEVHRTWG